MNYKPQLPTIAEL